MNDAITQSLNICELTIKHWDKLGDFPTNASIYRGFSIATFESRGVILICGMPNWLFVKPSLFFFYVAP